jgi:serine/threonine-protein kinase
VSADRSALIAAALGARYAVERELGAGGMATVYLAEDVRHHRKVAIKVLHPELSAVLGPERFLKEIELTAGLQHPHILPLFDSGSADGQLYYVMPFVEGETLRTRLERECQLPVADAVRIAREVADALAHAHSRGVIHRDVKPENILLQGGHALVADFGIALAVQQAGGHRITQTGLSLGTPQYMAPEQAAGEKSVDARADIFALGAVTYEMLAGEPPFAGPTTQAVIARVLTAEPTPLAEARRSVPAPVSAAVHVALAKLAADRFSTAAEFAAALGVPASIVAPAERGVDTPLAVAPSRPKIGVPRVLLGVAGVLAIATGAFWLGGRILGSAGAPLSFGRATRLTWTPGLEVQPAISPDGRAVAYAAGTSTDTHIYVRQVSGGRAIRVSDDSAAIEEAPSWSPDGNRVLYISRGAVFSAPAAGGPPRQEVPAIPGVPITAAAWAPDGRTIAYAAGDSVLVRAPDGTTRVVAKLLEPTLCAWSPNAQLIACGSGNARYLTLGSQFGNLSPDRIVVFAVQGGASATITDSSSINVSPIWSRDGRWLYYVSNRDGRGDVYAQHIARDGRADAKPLRLTTGLGANSISLSADGSRLAYAIYTPTSNIWSLPVPTGPAVTAASAVPVTIGAQVIENLNVSHDGRWLLYESDVAGNSDIYRVPLGGGTAERLTSDPADEFAADLSPAGREIAFHSWRTGSRDLWVQPLDGGALQHVTTSRGHEWTPKWSPDGHALVYISGVAQRSVWIVRRDARGTWGTPTPRLATGYWPVWSPDGRSIAYGSSLLGGSLMVAPSDSGAPRVVVDGTRPDTPQAERPQWSDDGRTLYFKSHDAEGRASFWSVPAAGGTPRLLVRLDDPARPSYRPQWAFGRGRLFFPVEDRQSDVWVMGTRNGNER